MIIGRILENRKWARTSIVFVVNIKYWCRGSRNTKIFSLKIINKIWHSSRSRSIEKSQTTDRQRIHLGRICASFYKTMKTKLMKSFYWDKTNSIDIVLFWLYLSVTFWTYRHTDAKWTQSLAIEGFICH